MKTIELKSHERIIAVVPEKVDGIGYSNSPAWVYILSPVTGFREECIQPEDQSDEFKTLFRVGEVICQQLQQSIKIKRID